MKNLLYCLISFIAGCISLSDTGGTGLGLAIAKEIVSLHGGRICAASENEVNTFSVVLPAS